MKYHANAKLTVRARRDLVERMAAGWAVDDVAEQLNVSRTTVYKWWRRWQVEGDAGLVDRSSRPKSCPNHTPRATERRIVTLRQSSRLGPARIAGIVGMHPSTVRRVVPWSRRVTSATTCSL